MPNKSIGPMPFSQLRKPNGPRPPPDKTVDSMKPLADKASVTSSAASSPETQRVDEAVVVCPETTNDQPTSILAMIQAHSPNAIATRVLFFLPWCIAVGACIVVVPSWLDFVAFGTGYTSPRDGAHRLAYWAECAMPHVAIFCAVMVSLLWWNIPLGCVLAAGVLALFVQAWRDFEVDENIPLGDDDRQTIYFLLMDRRLDEQTAISGFVGRNGLVRQGSLDSDCMDHS
jgi:hypothetical protein